MGYSVQIPLIFVALTLACLALGSPVQNEGIVQLSLNADRDLGVWTVSGNNGTADITVSAGVPGGVYSDLEANGIFDSEIYHDYNDLETQWVGRTNWTFSRQFTPSTDILAKNKIVLVCEGLDTIADVYINDLLVGSSKNMFVRYIFDIKFAIRLGVNTIRVAFQSPVEYAQREYIRHMQEYGYPVLPSSLVPEYRGENQAQMIRKMQSSFSWDWGPSYPSSGIWQNIFIQGLSGAVIRDVLIFTDTASPMPDETDNTEWNLIARVYFDVAPINEIGTLTLKRSGTEDVISVPVTLSSGASNEPRDVNVTLTGSTAKLWWPNGYGEQNLYTYEISYHSDTVNETSTKTLRVGFRTVELIQDFVNSTNESWGREFYFRVNGMPIYSKGSNSIPIHVLPERITEDMTRWLMESAKDVHSNMIRVWGGGMYESDLFFDLADELGIFIWEDFMFACAMYPATSEFLLNVVDEVDTQVKRLQHHPSLAMWAANNENEAALRQNWYGTDSEFDKYKEDFIKLYVDTIMANVTFLDPSRQCISSSPTNGIQSEMEGWIAENPGDSRYGDIHHYDYYGDSWDTHTFTRKTRYASEYGYQSFPYIETLAEVTDQLGNWTWGSDLAENRQHHPKGQEEIRMLIQSHLPYPVNYNSTEAFPAMLYMAQIMQAMGQKTQTEFYRRWVDKIDTTDGSGHNMGALYWQLNDIWQGCSWASFEINGRWKMFANYIQRSFNPILPSAYKEINGDVVIELVSDMFGNFSGEMRVRVFTLDSMTPVMDLSVPVETSYLTSPEVHRIASNELATIGCDGSTVESPCLVYLTIPGIPDNFLWLQYPTNKEFLKNPNVRATQFTASPDLKTFTVSLSSDEVAPFVFLNLKEQTHGKFNDNGFIMVDSPKTLTYTSRDPITLQNFISQLDIISLFNVTSLA